MVPDKDVGVGPRTDGLPNLQANRSKDVALLAVGIVKQSDAGRAVRIVFDRRHLGRDTELVPLVVDLAIAPLGAAAAKPNRDLSCAVAPADALLP
jgi:hypothetical protein